MLRCKIDHSSLKKIISYGNMPIANGFLKHEDFPNEYFFELVAAFCPTCKILQIVEQPDPAMMFNDNYAFFSSTSKKMAEHFEKMANVYINEYLVNPSNSFIVELGSNDGIMLRHFAKMGIKHIGIEPSENVAEVARQNDINTISKFFSKETAIQIEKEYGKADIICAANVLCHIPDLASVGKGVDVLLKENGIFVFEDPYLGDVIQKTSYDQIYDEHVYLFTLQSVSYSFAPYGFEVFRVEPQSTHGGSMRYYLCRRGRYPVHESVQSQLAFEKNLGLDEFTTFETFAQNCFQSKQDLVNLLQGLKAKGKRVVGYAATSKSTTVLNFCKIGPDLIEYICDTTPLKQGKYSPGMHIPIKPYEDFKKDNPDYAVLFAWNHAEEIFEKEKDFIARGGQWITFIPKIKILPSNENFIHRVA